MGLSQGMLPVHPLLRMPLMLSLQRYQTLWFVLPHLYIKHMRIVGLITISWFDLSLTLRCNSSYTQSYHHFPRTKNLSPTYKHSSYDLYLLLETEQIRIRKWEAEPDQEREWQIWRAQVAQLGLNGGFLWQPPQTARVDHWTIVWVFKCVVRWLSLQFDAAATQILYSKPGWVAQPY